MLTVRVIARLDVATKRAPLKRARELEACGADALWIFGNHVDCTLHVVGKLRSEISIPIAAACPADLENISECFEAGADRVLLPAHALSTIAAVAERYGSSSTTAAIDTIEGEPDKGSRLRPEPAGSPSDDPVHLARLAAEHGAGEIALSTFCRAGALSAPDGEWTAAISSTLQVPLVAAGIATWEQGYTALSAGADAVLARDSVGEAARSIVRVKFHLAELGIRVRPQVGS